MPVLGLAVPVPPPVEVVDRSGLAGMTWTAWDGTEWDLLSTESGVQLMPGVRGLGAPDVVRWTSSAPSVAGSRWRGSRVGEREVFWPVLVWSDTGSAAWVEHDRAWWAGLHPDRPGVWRVVHPDGRARELVCRWTGDAGQVMDRDPTAAGWQICSVALVAEDPFWAGDPVRATWTQDAGTNFFGGVPGGSGPPLFIGPGSVISAATLANPGDAPAFPVWRIAGPFSSVSVGAGGRVVTLTGTVLAGQSRVVDCRPDRQTVTDQDGVDRISEVTSAQFAAIAPGQTVSLSLAMTGTGTVSAEIRPRHLRAW